MNNQRLTIRTSSDSLAFATTDGREVVYERYPLKSGMSVAANMREALTLEPMLQQSYQRVTVLTDSPVLMTPADLFREEERDDIYRYTFTGQELRYVTHSVVPGLNAVAVFSVLKDLRQVLTDRYGQVEFFPVSTPVWHHLHQKSFTGSHAKLYAYFHDHRMEVFCFAQNRFKFYNSYAADNPDDALYYLLAAWKLLALEPYEDELHLTGAMSGREELLDKVRQYVKHVFVSNPTGEFNRAQVTQIKGMPYDLILYYLKGL